MQNHLDLKLRQPPTHCPKKGGSRIYRGKGEKEKYLSVVAKKVTRGKKWNDLHLDRNLQKLNIGPRF